MPFVKRILLVCMRPNFSQDYQSSLRKTVRICSFLFFKNDLIVDTRTRAVRVSWAAWEVNMHRHFLVLPEMACQSLQPANRKAKSHKMLFINDVTFLHEHSFGPSYLYELCRRKHCARCFVGTFSII